MRSLIVPAGVGLLRVDSFVARHAAHCSRRLAQRAIAAGEVRVNGRRARKGQSVRAGDVVEVSDTLSEPPALRPNPDLVVPVLFEDAAVIALDKPAGMPSHALRADETQTAANFLLARYPELAAVGKNDREPGLVHRLDTETSGVLLVARTAEAYEALRRQFSGGQVTKEYLAIVDGDLPLPGDVRTPIAHDGRNRRKMRVCSNRGGGRALAAITHYTPLERFGDQTLLTIQIPTGVMHQIRVHLASIGHPIVGDRLYGNPVSGSAPARHLLHASRLVFQHPHTCKPIAVHSPLPGDFAAFLARLRRQRRRRQPGR